jgi:hypothetical protein
VQVANTKISYNSSVTEYAFLSITIMIGTIKMMASMVAKNLKDEQTDKPIPIF